MSLEAPSSPAKKLRALRQALAAHPSAVVAFSGGVDSTFVLRIAREEIGDGVLALTTTSASMPARELAEARRLAEEIGRGENLAFRRNIANRLWAMMMGRGLVHPVDLHHSGNPAAHPELLDLLRCHPVGVHRSER